MSPDLRVHTIMHRCTHIHKNMIIINVIFKESLGASQVAKNAEDPWTEMGF